MAKIMKLGTLCFGGQPMIGMPKYGGERLSIGDSVPGKEIHWVSARGILVADRCICVNISWGQLLDFGFLFGTRIRIDGKSYTCRCLMGGEGPLCPNEWDDLLNTVGEDNEIWHWISKYFWCQETQEEACPTGRVVRGFFGARIRDTYMADTTAEYIGFRPVLEPVPDQTVLCDALIGSRIVVRGPGKNALSGELVGFDNYDLVLKGAFQIPKYWNWVRGSNTRAIISRDSITQLLKTD